MKIIFQLACCSIFLFFSFGSSAQESKAVSETISGYPRGKSMKLANDEYVYVTGKYEATSDLNIVKFNSNARVLWKKALPDGVMSLAKINNNIVVFSSKEWAKNIFSNIKTIH